MLVLNEVAEFTPGFEKFCEKFDDKVEMDPLITTFREKYADDLSRRLGLDNKCLPPAYTTLAILNPMFGLKPVIVGSTLMTSEQYEEGREFILRAIQDDLDDKNPPMNIDSGDEDSLDGHIVTADNDNYRLAEKELQHFEEFKRQKYQPKMRYNHCLSNTDEKGRLIKLGVGTVEQRGDDLPSGKNLVDYLDDKGRFKLIPFFLDHKARFQNLFTIVQREAPRRVVEVGCERFFGVSGYNSQPRWSRLGVRTMRGFPYYPSFSSVCKLILS